MESEDEVKEEEGEGKKRRVFFFCASSEKNEEELGRISSSSLSRKKKKRGIEEEKKSMAALDVSEAGEPSLRHGAVPTSTGKLCMLVDEAERSRQSRENARHLFFLWGSWRRFFLFNPDPPCLSLSPAPLPSPPPNFHHEIPQKTSQKRTEELPTKKKRRRREGEMR